MYKGQFLLDQPHRPGAWTCMHANFLIDANLVIFIARKDPSSVTVRFVTHKKSVHDLKRIH